MNRLDETFRALKDTRRAALMPYLPLGFPTLESSRELITAAVQAGADILELGIPFSDPLADGPVIAKATQTALDNGMTVKRCLDIVEQVRADGIDIPLVLMGYYNPILRFGIDRFAHEAASAGADGVIVPDLPLEEAGSLSAACESHGLDLVFMAAPTSPPERLQKISAATRGFLYMVSLTGTTGMRDALPEGLSDFLERTHALTDKPLCVGFGISNADNARRVAGIADGVIVGTAMVTRIADPATAVSNTRQFVRELADAISSSSNQSRITIL